MRISPAIQCRIEATASDVCDRAQFDYDERLDMMRYYSSILENLWLDELEVGDCDDLGAWDRAIEEFDYAKIVAKEIGGLRGRIKRLLHNERHHSSRCWLMTLSGFVFAASDLSRRFTLVDSKGGTQEVLWAMHPYEWIFFGGVLVVLTKASRRRRLRGRSYDCLILFAGCMWFYDMITRMIGTGRMHINGLPLGFMGSPQIHELLIGGAMLVVSSSCFFCEWWNSTAWRNGASKK